jgi:hypothetical protein
MCVFLCLWTGRGLATSWSPVQGVLPNVQDLVNWSEMESFMEVSQGPNVGCSAKGKNVTKLTCMLAKWLVLHHAPLQNIHISDIPPVTVSELKKFWGLKSVAGIINKSTLRLYNPSKLHSMALWSWWCALQCQDIFVNWWYMMPVVWHFKTVFELLNLHWWHGYRLYMDNYYNSVCMVKQLHEQIIGVCGIIMQNNGTPCDLKDHQKTLKKGEMTFRRDREVLLLS